MNVLPFAFYSVSIVLIVLVIFVLIFIFSYIMALLDVIGRSLNNLSTASSKCSNSNSASMNCFYFKAFYGIIQGYLDTVTSYYNIILELSRYLGLIIVIAFVVLALSVYVTAKQTVWKFELIDKIVLGVFFVLFGGLVALIPVVFSKVTNYTGKISSLCSPEITENTQIYCLLLNYLPSISNSMFISVIILISSAFLIYSVTFVVTLLTKVRSKQKAKTRIGEESSGPY